MTVNESYNSLEVKYDFKSEYSLRIFRNEK